MKIKWRSILAAGLITSVLLAAFSMQAFATGGNGYMGDGNFTFTNIASNTDFAGWVSDITPTKITGNARKKNGSNASTPCQVHIYFYLASNMQQISGHVTSVDSNFDYSFSYDGGNSNYFNKKLHIIVYAVYGSSNLMIGSAFSEHRKLAITNSSGSTEYKLIGVVGNAGQRKYWIDTPAVNANLTVSITAAKNSWVNSGMFNFAQTSTQTSTQSSAQVRFFYTGLTGNYTTVPAITDMFSSAGVKVNGTANWSWAEIKMNANSSAPFNMFNYDQRAATIAHEWGHAMGLDHPHEKVFFGRTDLPYPTDRLMMPYPLRIVLNTSRLDLKALQSLY